MTTMVQAIETDYDGYRFRSRLEARWYIFLKAMGVRPEYEHQGYKCSQRLTNWCGRGKLISYLPDFWMPDQRGAHDRRSVYGVFGEVKGTLDEKSLLRLLDVAASLSTNDGAGCHDSGGSDLVVFGNMPDILSRRVPVALHMCKGQLEASPWIPGVEFPWMEMKEIGQDSGDMETPSQYIINLLTQGYPISDTIPAYREALDRARRARFEHGEYG